jgi:hypothetical protein
MDTVARHRIAIGIIQDAHQEDLDEAYALARMIREGVSVAALLYSACLSPTVDRFPGLREKLETLGE